MKGWLRFFIVALSAGVASTVAADGTSQALTQPVLTQCVKDVRASGSFTLIEDSSGAQLVSSTGASTRDIANVNDCLADVQQIQYTEFALSPQSAEIEEQTARSCMRQRNEKIAVGLLLTAGVVAGLGATDGAIIGGVIGSVVGVGRLQNEYKKCLNAEFATAQANGVSFGGACGGGKSVLQGGTGYCFR
ncbi:MAG: hypothetical protein ACU0BB_16610 [Paracoccaceae bacterium]|jgi:hypothetical protein